MQLTYQPLTLDLRIPFRIAHGVSTQRHNVLVRIDEGLGEAAAVPQYNQTRQVITAYLDRVSSLLGDDPFMIEDILARLPQGSLAARCAIDMALHDLVGRRLGQPLYRLLGLNPASIPPTSLTISIDEPARMAELAAQSQASHLKIKLGSPDDEAIIRAIRQVSDARLYVDANCGWSYPQALELIPRLAAYDLELIEQPLPVDDLQGWCDLRKTLHARGVKTPIFADESACSPSEIASLAGLVDGVVVKLMKSGGIRGALRAITVARALDMQVMLSCMIESSLSVTAAAHLAPLVDLVDLDGPLTISNDPFTGLRYHGDRILLPAAPGLGVSFLVPPS